jgi:hypothetical protein
MNLDSAIWLVLANDISKHDATKVEKYLNIKVTLSDCTQNLKTVTEMSLN